MKNPWKFSMPAEWKTSSFYGDVDWNKKAADYFKGTQGSKLTAKHAWNVSKDLINSIKNNAETFIENPTSNRWIGKDKEYLEPKRGMSHVQVPSTCIESIIVDKNTSRNNKNGTVDYKVSISFDSTGKYYDYWATLKDIEELINAPSKGREVVENWNGHWEGQPGSKVWIHNPVHYYS